MFKLSDFFHVYRDEAGGDGDTSGGAAVEGAATEGAATEGAATEGTTVLTGDTDSETVAEGATDDDTTGDTTGGDAGKEGNDVVPDTYADFTMPEDIQIDEAALTEAIPVFKELGLTQEQAQKIVDLQAQLVQAGSEKQVNDFNQLMTDWRTQTEADNEIGGDKFEENVKAARSAVATYGTPELKQLLEEQGVGNHPEVVRFMVRVGKTLKEDIPGSTGAIVSEAQSRVDLLYPKDT